MSHIVPAVLPTSRKELVEKIALLAKIPEVGRIQIDIVDGKFAGPVSWPYNASGELESMVERNEMLPHLERITYEIDLMCFDSIRCADMWLALGATRLTFHCESTTDLPRFIETIKKRYGTSAGFAPGLISIGLALNVNSPLLLLDSSAQDIDYAQFMGIATIGKQGQPFDRRVLDKIKLFHAKYPNITLQADGGVSIQTAQALLEAGVSELVVGSAIVRSTDPSTAFMSFTSLIKAAERKAWAGSINKM